MVQIWQQEKLNGSTMQGYGFITPDDGSEDLCSFFIKQWKALKHLNKVKR